MGFFTVIKFFTIFPSPFRNNEGPEQLGKAVAFFPVIGLIIGILLAGAAYLFRLVFPLPVTGALLVMILATITGAHHLDGLMDTCDGMVAGKTKQQRLEIMSDTRVGAFGITGACLILLLKYAALSSAPGIATLLVFPAASRWALTGAILIFPSAKGYGTGYQTRLGATWGGFIISSLITLIICLLCCGIVQGLLLMIVLIGLVYVLGRALCIMYGGLTGDSYGAIVETGEALALLLILVINRFWTIFPGSPLIVFP